jgi:hypothetical protein
MARRRWLLLSLSVVELSRVMPMDKDSRCRQDIVQVCSTAWRRSASAFSARSSDLSLEAAVSSCGLVFVRDLPGVGLYQGSPDHWNGRREDRAGEWWRPLHDLVAMLEAVRPVLVWVVARGCGREA